MSPRLRSSVGFSTSLWSSASAVPCRTMALGLLPTSLANRLTVMVCEGIISMQRSLISWTLFCGSASVISTELTSKPRNSRVWVKSSSDLGQFMMKPNFIKTNSVVSLSLLAASQFCGSLTCSRPGIGPSWLRLAAAVLWLVSVILWKFEARTPAQTGAPWTGRPDPSKWIAGTCDDRGESVSQSKHPSGLSCKTSRPVRSCSLPLPCPPSWSADRSCMHLVVLDWTLVSSTRPSLLAGTGVR